MKAVIVNCMGDLVKEKFGKEKWEQCLEGAGMSRNSYFLSTQDVDDATVKNLAQAACRVLGLTGTQLSDAFGDYWVNVFAQKIYKVYFHGARSAKELLLKMDDLHATVTRNIENARPPRFEYAWVNDKTLRMKYRSQRGMIDFLVGLVRGVGRYYNERLSVQKVSESEIQVVFG